MLLHILVATGVLFLWTGAAGLLVYMPPIAGALWVCALLLLFARLVISRAGSETRYRPALSNLPLSRLSIPLLGAVVLAVSVLYLVLQTYYFRLMPPQPEVTSALERYAQQPLGWIARILVVVVFAPIVEEFVFRGWVLRSIERRAGIRTAIGLSAVLFSVLHFDLWAAPFHMISGVVYGIVVVTTSSIWAGVLVHITANATGQVMAALNGPAASPARWLDILRIPAEAQPILGVCAVAALAGVLWRLRVRTRAPTQGHTEFALGEG